MNACVKEIDWNDTWRRTLAVDCEAVMTRAFWGLHISKMAVTIWQTTPSCHWDLKQMSDSCYLERQHLYHGHTIGYSRREFSMLQRLWALLHEQNLAYLQVIYLSKNLLTDLHCIEQFRKTRTLSLADNLFGNFEKLEPLRQLPKLETLSLEGNPLSRLPNYRAQVQSSSLSLIFQCTQLMVNLMVQNLLCIMSSRLWLACILSHCEECKSHITSTESELFSDNDSKEEEVSSLWQCWN